MIALSLACFIVPLCIGCLFKHKQRDRATWIMNRFSKPYLIVCVIIVLVSALVTNYNYHFTMVTWRHLLSGLLVGGLGFFTGATLAFICRQGRGLTLSA